MKVASPEAWRPMVNNALRERSDDGIMDFLERCQTQKTNAPHGHRGGREGGRKERRKEGPPPSEEMQISPPLILNRNRAEKKFVPSATDEWRWHISPPMLIGNISQSAKALGLMRVYHTSLFKLSFHALLWKVFGGNNKPSSIFSLEIKFFVVNTFSCNLLWQVLIVTLSYDKRLKIFFSCYKM